MNPLKEILELFPVEVGVLPNTSINSIVQILNNNNFKVYHSDIKEILDILVDMKLIEASTLVGKPQIFIVKRLV